MNHLRQLDIIDPGMLNIPIHIIGCGSVGSWTALTLAKIGATQLTLWDFDVVEEHNIPNQAFRPADIGRPKVEALGEIIEVMTGNAARPQKRRFDGLVDQGMVVVAVDSMDGRIALWRALRDQPIDWLIDSRMGAEVARILTVKVSSLARQRDYGRTLYRSTDALQEPCTARSTAYCATGLASYLTAKVVKILTGRPFSTDITIDFRNGLILGSQTQEVVAAAV